jgi:hypothetical protein
LVPTIDSDQDVTPLVTLDPEQVGTLKDFSYNVKGLLDTLNVTITGKYPADSVTDTNYINDGGIGFSNSKYSLELSFSLGGELLGFSSYQKLSQHDQFEEIYRVKMNENDSYEYYVMGPITTSGSCNYLGQDIPAPCGGSYLSGGEDPGFILNVLCMTAQDSYDLGISTCDSIVDSLRVQ